MLEAYLIMHKDHSMGRKVPTDSPIWGEMKVKEVNRRSATVSPAPDRREEG